MLNNYLDTYKQQANAANSASKNQLDLAQNLLKLGAQGAGSSSGGSGGSNGSSLSNLFGGNFFPAF
jgi:hypothetical protein